MRNEHQSMIGNPELRGGILAGFGVLLILWMVGLEAVLFLIVIRWLGVAIGGGMIAVGLLIVHSESMTPLTPVRAWVVPVSVLLGLILLALVDLQKIGFEDYGVVIRFTEGLLLAAACGVPLGVAIKFRNRTHLLGAGLVGTSILILTASIENMSIVAAMSPGRSIIFAVFAAISIFVGYSLGVSPTSK